MKLDSVGFFDVLADIDNGVVESTRGAHGGYRLSRAPDAIRMGEIVRALEGQIAPMICATEGEMGVICDRLDGCSTKYLWARVRDAITGTLDAITLADLVAESDAVRVSPPTGARMVTFTLRLEHSAGRGAATAAHGTG